MRRGPKHRSGGLFAAGNLDIYIFRVFIYNKSVIPEKLKSAACGGNETNMKFTYRPRGVCSQMMEIETEGEKIKELKVTGGCSGNLQGISQLVRGMEIDEAIARLEGIRCGFKATSCPDQLAKALKKLREEQ